MAVFALTSEYCAINSVDYSDHLKSAVLTVDANELDTTDFASGGWVEMIGGLKSGTLALEFMDDVADADVDDELWALLGTVVAFEVRPTSAGVGAGNPKYTGSVLITGHSIGGAVGDLAAKSLSFPTSGTVTRAEA
jgi:predicted secreted protein